MSKTETPTTPVDPLESVKLFNEFQSQSRARIEATLKLVMAVSGVMLTLSVGALLSGTPAKIPTHLMFPLRLGIGSLFFAIAASMLLMASMIVATFHMGVRWRKALESKDVTFTFVATWGWLRIANAVLGFGVLCAFLVGMGLLAKVAVGVVDASSSPTTSVSESPSNEKRVIASTPVRPATQALQKVAPNPSHQRTTSDSR